MEVSDEIRHKWVFETEATCILEYAMVSFERDHGESRGSKSRRDPLIIARKNQAATRSAKDDAESPVT